jgi:hypothetical protein
VPEGDAGGIVRGVIGFHYCKATAQFNCAESQPAVIIRLSTTTLTNSVCSLPATVPMAMGRSKLGPSFFTSAGARLMVVRPKVKFDYRGRSSSGRAIL